MHFRVLVHDYYQILMLEVLIEYKNVFFFFFFFFFCVCVFVLFSVQ